MEYVACRTILILKYILTLIFKRFIICYSSTSIAFVWSLDLPNDVVAAAATTAAAVVAEIPPPPPVAETGLTSFWVFLVFLLLNISSPLIAVDEWAFLLGWVWHTAVDDIRPRSIIRNGECPGVCWRIVVVPPNSQSPDPLATANLGWKLLVVV